VNVRQRVVGFAVLFCVCAITTAVYVINARNRTEKRAAAAVAATASPAALRTTQQEPHVVFRTWRPPSQGVLALSGLDAPDRKRRATALDCERVAFAAGRGICLSGMREVVLSPYRAVILNADFEPQKEVVLSGCAEPSSHLPGRPARSRDRVRERTLLRALRWFLDSHDDIDMATGQVLHDLEQFTVTRGGEPFDAMKP
jgi:hypothetical protein